MSPSLSQAGKKVALLLVVVVVSAFLTFVGGTEAQAATTLKTYAAPSGAPLNTAYTAKVRTPGGTWQDLDEWSAKVDNYNQHTTSFVYFDTDGPVELSITLNSGPISTAVIRPANRGITPVISGSTMTFSISGPTKLSAMVNGDTWNGIDIFANPIEVNPPSPADPNVIYVSPGYHSQDYVVPSGKTLYLPGNAAIHGEVILDNASNSRIVGRGVIDRPASRAVSANFANQITIDGIIIDDFGDADDGGNAISLANATNVSISDIKAYSGNKWGDGIDTFNSSNISIDNIYLRTSDDAIAIYGSRASGGVYQAGYSKNISVTNSILAPDTAHPINIGTHGEPSLPGGGGTIESLTFSNIDIWDYHQALQISVTASDGTVVSNVSFSDLRIEDHAPGRIADVVTFNNPGFGLGPGRGIENVSFKNIAYTGSNSGGNSITGYSTSKLTQDVKFENLTVNGSLVTNAAAGNFSVANYTKNVQFISSGGSTPLTAAVPGYSPIDVAVNKTASTDSAQSGSPAASANDGNVSTGWLANDSATGHWWAVDFGTNINITGGTQITWPSSGGGYKYKTETSVDGIHWTMKSDKTTNSDTAQTQNDLFYDVARYLRLTLTGAPAGAPAGIRDVKVLAEPLNLALGEQATADSTKSGSAVSSGNDGDPTSMWTAADNSAGHSFTTDLGSTRTISYGTQVAWPSVGFAYKYKVDTSSDDSTWTTRVNKTVQTDSSQVQNDPFVAVARYVRVTLTGIPSGAVAGIYDFKVFGDLVNVAQGKATTADSQEAANPATSATDASPTTRWCANDSAAGHWLKIDLGSSMKITGGTQIMWERAGSPYAYKIDTSSDNTNWTTRVDKTTTDNGGRGQIQSDYFVATARYVRVTVTTLSPGNYASLFDFKVFGDSGNSTP